MLGAWLGCSSDVFLCQDDGGCDQGGEQGVCQPTGYCSFPDASCESGQRYGELAGGTLANTCVDPETIAEGSGSATGPAPTTSTSTSTATGPDPGDGTTAAVDESGPPPDPSPTGEPPGTDEGTTGSARVVCRIDEFDDGMLDPSWCPTAPPGIEISEHDDMLWLDLLPNQWDPAVSGQVGEVASCDPRPLLELAATVHVDHVPQVAPYTEGFLEVGNDAFRLGLGVIDDQLYAFVGEGGSYSGMAWQPYEPRAHHYWRIRGTDEGLVAEVSPDGAAWSHLHTYYVELMGEEGHAFLGVWSEMVPLGPDSAAFHSLEICALEN